MTSSGDNPVRDYLPGVLLMAAMLFFGYIILEFITPVAASFTAGLGRQMSAPARVAVGLGDAGRRFWWLILLVVAGFFVLFEKKYAGEKAIARRDIVAVLNLILFLCVGLLAASVAVELARAIS